MPLLFLLPGLARADEAKRRLSTYGVDIGILFDLLTFTVSGTVVEEVDPVAGRYRVSMKGQGPGVTARTDAAGIIRDGRFMPTETRSSHTVRGRESWVALTYDHERGLVQYHSVSHTLLLGRRRQVDDEVRIPPGQHVDDLLSAGLNFAAGTLDVEPDGSYRVMVVRRARSVDEGPDDVSAGGYRAELVTTRFRAAPETGTGRLTALVDITGWSSWARANRPARVVFGADRRLESVRSSLILGSSFTLRLVPAA